MNLYAHIDVGYLDIHSDVGSGTGRFRRMSWGTSRSMGPMKWGNVQFLGGTGAVSGPMKMGPVRVRLGFGSSGGVASWVGRFLEVLG